MNSKIVLWPRDQNQLQLHYCKFTLKVTEMLLVFPNRNHKMMFSNTNVNFENAKNCFLQLSNELQALIISEKYPRKQHCYSQLNIWSFQFFLWSNDTYIYLIVSPVRHHTLLKAIHTFVIEMVTFLLHYNID